MAARRFVAIALPVVMLLASAISASAQSKSSADAQKMVPLDPAVTYGTLSNGMTYYIRPNARPENRAELRLVVRAGSVLEDDDQQGLAHYVEHMAFNGTRNFKKQELINYLESIGVQFGPHLNAYTSFDETVYMLQVPTDSAGQLATAFQILEDWAHGLAFDHAEMDKERGVVIEEWRTYRGAWARMDDKTFPILYKGSRYAERLPIGKKEIVETAPYDAAKRFYRDWYRPDLMSVIAVGDFDKAKIEQLIKNHFGSIPAATNPRKKELYPIPDHDETLTAIAQDREATLSNVSITWKHPHSDRKNEGDFRERLVEQVFSGMIGSRFDEARIQGDPPFAFAFAGRHSTAPTKDFFQMTAYTQPGKVLRALEVIFTEAERVRHYGFAATEFERQKVEMMRNLERMLDEHDKTESNRLIWSYVSHALGNGWAPGIEAQMALTKKYLPTITLEEVNRLSSQLITKKNRVITVHAPEKEGVEIPTGDDMLAVLAKIEGGTIARYEDKVTDEPLMTPPTVRATIVSEQKHDNLNIVDWKLSNGVRVVVKPTDFKNDEVMVTAYSPGGTSLASDADYDAINHTSGIFSNAGVGQFDPVALQKKLTGKVAYVGTNVSELYEGVYGMASPKDLETMMQLLHLRFTAIRPDSGAFNSYKTMMGTFVENSENDPESLMGDTMSVTLSQYHPRSKPMNSQTLQLMDLKKSYDFYRNRFSDAGDFTFVFVGNIDLDQFKQLALTYLGTLPSTGRKENWRDIGEKYPTGVIEKTVRAGIEPKSMVRVTFPGSFEWTDNNRAALTAMKDVLDIMLREVLREDMGGTYGAWVYAYPNRYPRVQRQVGFGFGCAPERVTELTDAAFATIDSLKRVGPSEINLRKVKEQARRDRETKLKENRFWMEQIEETLQNGEELADILSEEKLTQELTAKDVQEAAQKYLDTKNYVKVVLYPKTQVAGSEGE